MCGVVHTQWCNLFLAVELLRGWRTVRVTNRRTVCDLAEQLRLLVDGDYLDAEKRTLVMDNLDTHSAACLYERFAPAGARRIADRIERHYTPKHGSWLNSAKCELSTLGRQRLTRRIPDIQMPRREATAWHERRNRARVKIDWHFTTSEHAPN
jgi:transposase